MAKHSFLMVAYVNLALPSLRLAYATGLRIPSFICNNKPPIPVLLASVWIMNGSPIPANFRIGHVQSALFNV